uniref:Uncharacterized protein n=1 Tax=Vespula pensylvanica TaxID=30213 RepID=A0A834U4Z3_VESPE|nr:hypothetical protein H0235_011234 [Vespula pensylvanica]
MSFLLGGSRHTVKERRGGRRGERGGGSIDQCEAILKRERGEVCAGEECQEGRPPFHNPLCPVPIKRCCHAYGQELTGRSQHGHGSPHSHELKFDEEMEDEEEEYPKRRIRRKRRITDWGASGSLDVPAITGPKDVEKEEKRGRILVEASKNGMTPVGLTGTTIAATSTLLWVQEPRCVRGPNGPKTFMTFNQTNDERSCEYRDVEFICANEISVISSASGLSIAPTTIPSGTVL